MIIGTVSKETETHLTVKNPAMIHINAKSLTSQLQLQVLPMFFKDFTFNKQNITKSEDNEFSDQIIARYTQMFNPVA